MIDKLECVPEPCKTCWFWTSPSCRFSCECLNAVLSKKRPTHYLNQEEMEQRIIKYPPTFRYHYNARDLGQPPNPEKAKRSRDLVARKQHTEWWRYVDLTIAAHPGSEPILLKSFSSVDGQSNQTRYKILDLEIKVIKIGEKLP